MCFSYCFLIKEKKKQKNRSNGIESFASITRHIFLRVVFAQRQPNISANTNTGSHSRVMSESKSSIHRCNGNELLVEIIEEKTAAIIWKSIKFVYKSRSEIRCNIRHRLLRHYFI